MSSEALCNIGSDDANINFLHLKVFVYFGALKLFYDDMILKSESYFKRNRKIEIGIIVTRKNISYRCEDLNFVQHLNTFTTYIKMFL